MLFLMDLFIPELTHRQAQLSKRRLAAAAVDATGTAGNRTRSDACSGAGAPRLGEPAIAINVVYDVIVPTVASKCVAQNRNAVHAERILAEIDLHMHGKETVDEHEMYQAF